jgi:hypothetical protein
LWLACSLHEIPRPADDLGKQLFALLQANYDYEGAYFSYNKSTSFLVFQRALENQQIALTRFHSVLDAFVNALERTSTGKPLGGGRRRR